MGKIIFMDVDGTLINYENHIPQSAIDAIRKARKNGHKVYICTGRSEAEVYQDIWEVSFNLDNVKILLTKYMNNGMIPLI